MVIRMVNGTVIGLVISLVIGSVEITTPNRRIDALDKIL